MKAVLDTNVWLDWLMFADPASRLLQAVAARGALDLLASAATRAEWLDVTARPKFGLDDSQRRALDERYLRHVRVLDDPPAAPPLPDSACRGALVCSDADDQKFLDLALAAGAPFLITRDRALLDLGKRARSLHGLTIVRPDAACWRRTLAACLATRANPARL